MKTWIGRGLCLLVGLFFVMDAVTHILMIQPVVEAFEKLQIPLSIGPVLGGIVIVCLVFFAVPRTRILGAVLLTSYLGGAVAIHLRAGSTLFEIVFPVILGAVLWLGLRLCDSRAKVLLG